MRKFFAYFRTGMQETLTYRAESLVWLLLELLGLIPIISLWIYMLNQGRLDFSSASFLVTYYFLGLVISRLTNSNFEDWAIGQIKDGFVSTILVKPTSYMLFVFTQEITWNFFGLIYLVPIFTIAFIFFKEMILPNINPILIIPTLVILGISFISRLLVSWIISLTAFWIEQSKSVVHLKWMLEGILGGQWLPLIFFPLWFQSFARFTPFYYWYYFPISLVTNRLNLHDIIIGSLVHLVWFSIIYLLGKRIWSSAVKKYSAIGN